MADSNLQILPQVINGGIEIEVQKINGSVEKVKVRQLPQRFIPDYGRLGDNESDLVELLCDKIDNSTGYHMRNAIIIEQRLLEIQKTAVLEQMPKIEERLQKVRTEIAALEKTAHWSDSLTEESMLLVIDFGKRLNQKKFLDWAKRRSDAFMEHKAMKELTNVIETVSRLVSLLSTLPESRLRELIYPSTFQPINPSTSTDG
jgi:hypothetical protein